MFRQGLNKRIRDNVSQLYERFKWNNAIEEFDTKAPLKTLFFFNQKYLALFLYKSISASAQQNQQNGMCTQQRLRSAWASAQSDQPLLCAQWVV